MKIIPKRRSLKARFNTRFGITALFIAVLLFSQSDSKAYEIINSKASLQSDIFYINIIGVVNSPLESVFKVLTDYENLVKINPKIIESKIIDQNENYTLVQSIVEGCILFFCNKINNLQNVTISDFNITSITIPQENGLKFGRMNWILKEDETSKDKTIIEFSAEIDPNFFIPPLIGSYFVKHFIKSEVKQIMKNLENLAN